MLGTGHAQLVEQIGEITKSAVKQMR